MNDFPRLRTSGSPDDRALLSGADAPAISELAQREIRRALEQRLSPRGRRRAAQRLALALAGTLLAGSALAYTVTRIQTRRQPPDLPPPTATVVALPVDRVPAQALPSPPPPPPPPPSPPPPSPPPAAPPARAATASPTPRRQISLRTAAAVPREFPLGMPALRGPQDLLLPLPPGEDAEENPTAAPSPRLLITRPGRAPFALVLAGDRIVGKLRNSQVALTISPALIVGKLGQHRIWLWLHSREAKGMIDDVPLRYELIDTSRGLALRAGRSVPGPLPARTTRITATDSALTWSPGCNVPLAAVAAGVYQGRCARGSQVRVEIPPRWQQLPVLPRLILLSLFLTERDPDLNHLFGAAADE